MNKQGNSLKFIWGFNTNQMRKKLLKKDIRYLKIVVAITSFVLLAIALLIAHESPAIGYELSIYSATPLAFWVCLFLGFTGGIGILIHQIVTNGYRDSYFWLIGLLILILSRITLLCLPYIRGYISWAGDNITHLGLVKDILFGGHFAGDNYYPITHILLSQVITVTGIPDNFVVNLSTTVFSVIFILSMYLLATAILPHRGQQLLVLILTGGVMLGGGYNVLLMPNGWSIFLMPLLFYCYYKRAIISVRILFIILLVLYPFFHPLSSLIVIMSLSVLTLSEWLFQQIFKRRSTSVLSLGTKATPFLIELVIFFPWVLSFQQFHLNLRIMWKQITTGIQLDVIGEMGMTLNKINIHRTDFIILLVKMYGVTIIFITLSLLGIYFILKKIFTNGTEKENSNFLSLGCVFLIYCLFYLLYLLGMPGLKALAGQRILIYVEAFTPIFASLALYEILQRLNFSRLVIRGVMLLVILSLALSIASLYRSPYVIYPNVQITQMDITGMSYFIDKKNVKLGCVYIMSPPYRFADGILGTIAAKHRGDIHRNVVQFPDHFNYDEYVTLGEQYSQDKYAVITKLDRIIYSTVWQEVGRFNDADFQKLEHDQNVNKLYENSELDIYYLKSKGINI